MNRLATCLLVTVAAIAPGGLLAQQASPTTHKYLYRAVLTTEGVKDLKMRTAVGLRNNIFKFVDSVGCKQDFWYFDFLNTTAYGAVECPSEAAVATIMVTVNAAPYARLTYWSVMSAEETDKAIAGASNARPPQQQ
jgi:hypothetical protein